MSINVSITQLPQAQTITGTEAVPIVQNGVTVQTTTAALAGSPVQTQSFLTANNEPTLPNSRALTVGTGLSLADGGSQGTLQVNLTGGLPDLNTLGTGIVAKTDTSTFAARALATSGPGISVSNGDAVAGNPTFQLTGVAAAIASASGTGMLAIVSGTAIANRTITGTASQIAVTDGDGANNPTIALVDDPIVPGVAGLTVPVGPTASRSISSGVGTIRYNTDSLAFEGYTAAGWGTINAGNAVTLINTSTGLTGGPITSTGTIALADTAVTPGVYTNTNLTVDAQGRITAASSGTAGGVTTFSAGSTGFTPSSATTGDVVLGGILNVNNGGTGTSTPALVAGTNVSITGTWPNQTINSSNSGGTVTSVAATVPAFLSVSGSPITTSGTLAISYSGTALPIANGGTGATTAPTARSNLSAAQSGANTDITSVTLTSGTISTAPSFSDDIANKSYVDAIATGINFHAACNYATAAALSAAYTYNNGTSGVGATITANAVGTLTIDGYTFTSGDVGKRILIKNETGAYVNNTTPSAAFNGVYTLTTAGTAGVAYVLTRATDYDTSGTGINEIDAGDLLLVLSGTTNANTSWVQQTLLPITVGTTSITFIQFAAVQTYTAGTGLSLITNQFSITNIGTAGTYGSASQVPVIVTNAQGQVTGVTNTNIAISGSAVSGNISGNAANVTGTVAIANGGTGQTTAAAAFNALSPVTTTGDLIIGNGTNSATRLAIGANNYVLTSNGTTATWSAATGGVSQIVAGTNVTISPAGGTGAVTINASGGASAYTRTTFTATAGQTAFTVTYAVGFLQIYVNGVLLTGSDYTASSGTGFTLNVACAVGDIVEALVITTSVVGLTTGKAIAMALIFGY